MSQPNENYPAFHYTTSVDGPPVRSRFEYSLVSRINFRSSSTPMAPSLAMNIRNGRNQDQDPPGILQVPQEVLQLQ